MQFSHKKIRQALGFKQQDVADACGVCKKTVARFEQGNSHSRKVENWYRDAESKVIASMISEIKK